MNQKWMIFRTEHSHIYYLWNGHYPKMLNPDATSKDTWLPKAPDNLEDSVQFQQERKELDTVLNNPRKKIFFIGNRPQRFVIVERGEFTKPEQ